MMLWKRGIVWGRLMNLVISTSCSLVFLLFSWVVVVLVLATLVRKQNLMCFGPRGSGCVFFDRCVGLSCRLALLVSLCRV